MGSPPHTWRILSKNTSFSEETRITSTHVENTKDKERLFEMNKDHLHTRGEYAFLAQLSSNPKGSPPHTWRILRLLGIRWSTGRITSTHVENT